MKDSVVSNSVTQMLETEQIEETSQNVFEGINDEKQPTLDKCSS